MEPVDETSEPVAKASQSRLHQVTPFSKYLAMALCISLPFIGGYIGYMYALGQVVGDETIDKESSVPKIINGGSIQPHTLDGYQTMYRSLYEIDFLYESPQTGRKYFLPLTYSSVPSRLVVYTPTTNTMSQSALSIDLAAGDTISPTGRFISKITNLYSPSTTINVIDLNKNESVITVIKARKNETLRSGECGYAGPTFDIQWTENSTIKYGVYEMLQGDGTECTHELIEYREISL